MVELPADRFRFCGGEFELVAQEEQGPCIDWLGSFKTGATPDDVDRFRQEFLRRDPGHTFRFAKGSLGWTTPKLRTPEAADHRTWIPIVAHTQLRLARLLSADLHGLCEKPNASGVQARSNSRRSPTRALQCGLASWLQESPARPIGESRALSPMPSHTSCHAPVTNTVDAPGPPSPNPREQHRIAPGGRQKTTLPTCARWWYPGTARSPGPERLPARQSGIAWCSVVSRSPGKPFHLSRDVTSPGWVLAGPDSTTMPVPAPEP